MSEKGEVKRDGAKAQKNSGRGKIQKGDAILDGLLTVDYKEYASSFSLSKTVWAKLCMDNFKNRTVSGVFKIILGENNEKVRLWVIEDYLFKEMYSLWKDSQNERGVVRKE